HLLVEVAHERFPPADHSASRLTEQRQALCFDELVVLGAFVRLDQNPPFAIDLARRLRRIGREDKAGTKRQENDRYGKTDAHDATQHEPAPSSRNQPVATIARASIVWQAACCERSPIVGGLAL